MHARKHLQLHVHVEKLCVHLILLHTFPHSPNHKPLTLQQEHSSKAVHEGSQIALRGDGDTEHRASTVWHVGCHREVGGELDLFLLGRRFGGRIRTLGPP